MISRAASRVPRIGGPSGAIRNGSGCRQSSTRTALIEVWLAAEPQLTAIAIVGRLAERHPEQFGKKQHSTVQRLLRALRKTASQRPIAVTAAEGCETIAQPPGAVDGSGYGEPDPPTAPLSVPALNVDHSANVLRPPAW